MLNVRFSTSLTTTPKKTVTFRTHDRDVPDSSPGDRDFQVAMTAERITISGRTRLALGGSAVRGTFLSMASGCRQLGLLLDTKGPTLCEFGHDFLIFLCPFTHL